MNAVVLEHKGKISIRNIEINEKLSSDDVRIKPVMVGICGSDIHYYLKGNIGEFIVKEPMVLGHEASGIITEVGSNVKKLKIGDRVCMEPGVPDFKSSQAKEGMYNLDPKVKFWATPPVHGCLRETVIHPANLTFKIPDHMSFKEGALVEPVAIGVYSAKKAKIEPGDIALVMGAGTIGIVTALAAEASGCSNVILADIKKEKLDFVKKHYNDRLITFDLSNGKLDGFIAGIAPDGIDIIFEASGSKEAYTSSLHTLKPGGRLILIGMPSSPVPIDIVALQVKEISVDSIFRYVNIYQRTINLISSGKLKIHPLVTHTYSFNEAMAAFDYASSLPGEAVKIMIEMN